MSLSDHIQHTFEEDPMYNLALRLAKTCHYTEESLREELNLDKKNGSVLDYAARMRILGHVRDIRRKEG